MYYFSFILSQCNCLVGEGKMSPERVLTLVGPSNSYCVFNHYSIIMFINDLMNHIIQVTFRYSHLVRLYH